MSSVENREFSSKNGIRKNVPIKGLVASSVALVISSVAMAEDTTTRKDLEVIEVTAERRVTNLQETPTSIAVLGNEEIQDRNILQVSDALRTVAGAAINQTGKGAEIYIRGIGAGLDPQMGSPGVSLMLDGRYQGQSATVSSGLYDIHRIEVLRGPQGTLYGRNATAGSVNVLTNEPSEDTEFFGSLTLGNYNLMRFEGMANVPVSDDVAIRLAAVNEDRDGYLSNDLQDSDYYAGRAKLLWNISADTELLLTLDSMRNDSLVGSTAVYSARDDEYQDDPWWAPEAEGVAYGGYSNEKSDAYSVLFNHNLDFANLTVQLSHQDWSLDFNRYVYGSLGDQTSSDKQNTVEVRLASARNDGPLEWVTGLFYLDTKKTDLIYTASGGGNTTDYPDIQQRSVALFGEMKWHLSDALSVYAGVRTTKDEQENTGRVYSGLPEDDSDVAYFNDKEDWSNTDYRVGAQMQLNSSSMIYGQFATAYKAGGMYQGTAPNAFSPEYLNAYSVGSKNRFFDNKLQLNFELFHYDYEDFQVQEVGVINTSTEAGTAFGLVVYNAAEATIKGGEIEGIWLASDATQIDWAVSLMDGQFGDDFIVPSPFFGDQDYSNRDVAHTPSYNIRLAVQHVIEIGSGYANFRFESEFSDSYWLTASQWNDTKQQAFERFNLSVKYQPDSLHWSVNFFIKNLTDTDVKEAAFWTPGQPYHIQLSAPRTFGLSASYRY